MAPLPRGHILFANVCGLYNNVLTIHICIVYCGPMVVGSTIHVDIHVHVYMYMYMQVKLCVLICSLCNELHHFMLVPKYI